MKIKILSLFLIVLVAQSYVAQASFFGTVTSAITGTVNTVVKAANSTYSTIVNVANATATGLGSAANTTIATVANTTIALANQTMPTTVNLVSNALAIVNKTVSGVTDVIANLTSYVDTSNISSSIVGVTGDVTKTILTSLESDIAALPNITQSVADQFLNIAKTFPKLFYSLISEINNAVQIETPSFNVLEDVQNLLNTTASDITNQILSSIQNGAEDLAAVSVPLNNTGTSAINNLVTVIDNATGIISNIVTLLEDTIAKVGAVIETDFQNIINLFSGLATTCANNISTAAQTFITNASANAKSCVTTEITNLQNMITQFRNLVAKYNAEIEAGTLQGSTLENTLTLLAEADFQIKTIIYRLPICESVKAVESASNLPSLISAIVSCN